MTSSEHFQSFMEAAQLMETAVGIEFADVDEKFHQELQWHIARLAGFLGVAVPTVTVPARGILKSDLTPEQKAMIDAYWGPHYAAHSVQFQDAVKHIPIQEQTPPERMVDLEVLFREAGLPVEFSNQPFPEACKNGWAGQRRVFWLRESVAHKIIKAAQALLHLGIKMKIEDAFRPVGVQEGLFERRITQRVDKNLSPQQQLDEARSKTGFAPWVSGHKWGASIDITLQTLDGRPLDLGNDYGQGGALVALECPYVTQKQWAVRQVFLHTMQMVGLTVYPYENWHASDGDCLAAVNLDGTVNYEYQTIYSPVDAFNGLYAGEEGTGEVTPAHPDTYYQPFYYPSTDTTE